MNKHNMSSFLTVVTSLIWMILCGWKLSKYTQSETCLSFWFGWAFYWKPTKTLTDNYRSDDTQAI